MKGKIKRLTALITVMMLVFGSTLVVNASNSTTIKRTTKVSDATGELNHTEVMWSNPTDESNFMSATFNTKRGDDVFDMYQLVDVTHNTDSTTGITAITVEWAKPIKDFITNSADLKALGTEEYAKYATPSAMGFYTIAADKNNAEAVAKEQAEKKAAEERAINLLRLLKAEKNNVTLVALATPNATTGKSYKVASVTKEDFGGTFDSSGAVLTFKEFTGKTCETGPSAVTITASQTGNDGSYSGITSYALGNLPFGLYFINASNPDRTNQGGYQPVLANLMPEQTGPTGVWYRNNENTLYLKNEGLKVTKWINGDKSDVVRVGEIVSFRVEIQIPEYMKDEEGNYKFTTYTAVDDMSKGFTLIPTSAKLTYFDDALHNGNPAEYHPVAQLNPIGSSATGNFSAKDTTEKTYTAYLIGTAYPFYNTADPSQTEYFYGTIIEDSATEQKIQFWTIADGALTQVRDYTFTKTNGTVSYNFTTSMIDEINYKRPNDKIPSSFAAENFVIKNTTKSLVGITFNYNNLMNPDSYPASTRDSSNPVYVKDPEFVTPDKFVVTYDAIVNDNFEIGTDNNTNIVDVYYVADSTGKIDKVTDEVVAWSYKANIVKVDGEAYDAYEKYQALTDTEKAGVQAPADPYLEGAKFDLYKYDATYCNVEATDGNITPNSPAARENYIFYSDESGAVFTDADDSAARYSKARHAFIDRTANGDFKKALMDALTTNGIQDATAIGTSFAYALGMDNPRTPEEDEFEVSLIGDYSELENFTNKYNYTNLYTETSVQLLKDQYSVNLLNDYMRPHAQLSTDFDDFMSDDDFTGNNAKFVQYVPVWMEDGCAFNETPHWHIDAYSLMYTDVTSNATETGVDVKGLDHGRYLMVETAAPEGGYNKLDVAMYFELNPWAEDEHDNKHTGCITEVYDHEDGNEPSADELADGAYKFTVKNFTGLQLPSTGGMGTLLFTIIGIIIMLAAIIFVVMKNKKIAKNAAAFMMMSLIVVATIASTTITSQAVTTINLTGSTSSGSTTKATKDGKATFTIHLKDQYDQLEVYKIADIEYDNATNGFKELAWDTSIYNPKSGTGYLVPNFENQTGLDPTYLATPAMFSSENCTAETKATFLSWVYDKKDEIGLQAIPSSYISANRENVSNHEWYTTINDVAYGIYIVKATNPMGRSYQVLALSAVPQLVGPSGGYYLTGEMDATLKYGDIKIDKTINGGDSDIVRRDEVVDFDIVSEVPEYQPINDGVILTDTLEVAAYNWNENYKYAFTDDMSKAFDYVPDSLKLYYTTEQMPKEPANDATEDQKREYETKLKAFNGSFAELSAAATKTIFAPTLNYATTKLNSQNGVAVYSDSNNADYLIYGLVTNIGTNNNRVEYYLYNKKDGSIDTIKDASGNALVYTNVSTIPASPSTEVKNRYAATINATAGTIARADTIAANDMRYVFAVTYDYSALRNAAKTGTTEKTGATYVKISYEGQVTENCLYGSEENTNTGTIHYRFDFAGGYESKSDTVHAYTYAVNIIKTDGKSETPLYLEGAQFTLYKEAYVFVPDEEAETAADNYGKFVFAKAATNDEYKGTENVTVKWDDDSDSATEATDHNILNLEELEHSKNQSGHKYYFRYVTVEDGNCGVRGCHYASTATTHQHVHVYEQVELKKQTGKLADGTTNHIDVTGATNEGDINKFTIVSNDKAEGVTITGLEDASYVLIEEKAPEGGYNPLTEAMRFEINSLSAETKALNNQQFGTDRAFYSSIATTETAQDAVKVNLGTALDPEYAYYTGYTEGVYSINVKNYKGLTLPSTGGMGTLLFTVVGIIIMMLAMLVVIARNRKNVNYQ